MRRWLPAAWISLAGAVLAADYFFGSKVSLTILFVAPVVFAARLSGGGWGLALGTLMPLAHFGWAIFGREPEPLTDLAIDAVIRIALLDAFAVLIAHNARQAREIRVLHGLLPVCSFCRKVRTEDQHWQALESYITEHSEASFTHTFCPECAQEHYGKYLGSAATGQTTAAPPSNNPVKREPAVTTAR